MFNKDRAYIFLIRTFEPYNYALQPTLSWFASSKGLISHKNLTGLDFVLKKKVLIQKTRIKSFFRCTVSFLRAKFMQNVKKEFAVQLFIDSLISKEILPKIKSC